ncbi:hypothetical protein [Pedobacter africanus]|uniref:hypothetical protein n=1 Tax=Pedobacter africanus TaxID=151894 RepID=UPI000A04DA5E|nr:hypothetical protein [Pedobacter africanus]
MRKGYWHAALDSELLPYNNIVKVKTRHFSDWTISTRLVMTSSKDSLKMGEVAILKVSYQTISEPLKDNDDLLAPELVINPEKVVAWDLTGEGKLTSAKNETAVYKAPVNIQKRSVVTVSVTLKDIWKEFWKPKAGQPTESYVFKDLVLVPDEYFYWDINGFTFESEPENLSAQFDGNANYSISGRTGNETYKQYLWAAIVGKDKGIRNFRNPEINDDNYVYVELLYTGLPLFSRYQCNNIKTSTIGNMIIKSIGGKGDYLEGTIKGELATEDKCNPVKRPLTARFRLKIK